jgi:hypothetical protein
MMTPPSGRCRKAAPGHPEVAVDVVAERPVPLLGAELGQVVDRLLGGDVVHQQVEAAEFGHGPFHRAIAVTLLGEIAAEPHAAPSCLTDQFRGAGGVLVLLLGQVRDRHVRAFLGEGHRNGPADARVAAGDQRAGAGQQSAAFVVAHLVPGMRVHLDGTAWIRLLLLGRGLLGRWRGHGAPFVAGTRYPANDG